MTPETVAKLNRLKNGPTRYEIVIETGYERYRLCYAARRSVSGLRDACWNSFSEIAEFTESTDALMFNRTQNLFAIGIWTIKFSGRTQREAISTETELRWFESVLKERRAVHETATA